MSLLTLQNVAKRFEGVAEFPPAKGFDPDDAMIVVPLAIWMGAEIYVLCAAAIGAPLFLAWTLWRFRRSLGDVPQAAREQGTSRLR